MIESLQIRDLAIVEQLDLQVQSGLTVLTGETGAGKSLVIGALALLLGGRGDADLIKHGRERAEVLGVFDVDGASEAAQWLGEHDLAADGECVLRRVISRKSASRAYINGRPVPVQQLRELGALLMDIHGQHEHQSLLRRPVQRQILDRLAGVEEAAEELAVLFRNWRTLVERRRCALEGREEAESRRSYLAHQIEELETAAPEPDEESALVAELKRLSHADELAAGLDRLGAMLSESDESSIDGLVSQAIGRLRQLVEYDAALDDACGLLDEAQVRVTEAARSIAARRDRLEHDPERVHAVESRLALLHALARKHRRSAAELGDLLEELQDELARELAHGVDADTLDEQIEATVTAYNELAAEISAGRRKTAQRLAESVTVQFQRLGMEGGHFEVLLSELADPSPTAFGREQIEFRVSANRDQPARSLAKVASGGELSRTSLAIQALAAGAARVPTLIFDEVDAGIGGRVADTVGELLHGLGESRQVLCITHLPQVAARADQQLQVCKDDLPEARVTVRSLGADERVSEIARMLAGRRITRQSLAHARELLEQVGT